MRKRKACGRSVQLSPRGVFIITLPVFFFSVDLWRAGAQGTLEIIEVHSDRALGVDKEESRDVARVSTTLTKDDLIDLVTSGIQSNYDQLGAVSATLRVRTTTGFTLKPVGKASEKDAADAKPALGMLVEEGVTHESVDVLFHAGGLRVRRGSPESAQFEQLITMNDRLVDYRPHLSKAVIERIDPTLPSGRLQYDPRDFGMISANMRILDYLRSANVDASIDEQGDVVTMSGMMPTGHRAVLEFSRKYCFLPVQVCYVKQDGFLAKVVNMTYREVVANGSTAWFVRNCVDRNAFPYRNTSPEDPQWGQVVTTEATDVNVNLDLPKGTFDDPEFPDGTLVVDMYTGPEPVSTVIGTELSGD